MNATRTAVEAIAVKKAEPISGWILGTQFDPSLLDGMPDLTRSILDQVSPEER